MSKISYKEQLNKNKAQLHNLRITKVVVNCGIGKLVTRTTEKQDAIVKEISDYLMMITGQKPKVCNARISVSGFKLREGMPVGLMVTLRGKRMNDFIDRFVNITLPRTRDFWGISKKHFDKKGNLCYGIKEAQIFPELAKETIKTPFGLEICFTTNAKNQEEGIKLFELLKFPLAKDKN